MRVEGPQLAREVRGSGREGHGSTQRCRERLEGQGERVKVRVGGPELVRGFGREGQGGHVRPALAWER